MNGVRSFVRVSGKSVHNFSLIASLSSTKFNFFKQNLHLDAFNLNQSKILKPLPSILDKNCSMFQHENPLIIKSWHSNRTNCIKFFLKGDFLNLESSTIKKFSLNAFVNCILHLILSIFFKCIIWTSIIYSQIVPKIKLNWNRWYYYSNVLKFF